jgi:hypothetical protein
VSAGCARATGGPIGRGGRRQLGSFAAVGSTALFAVGRVPIHQFLRLQDRLLLTPHQAHSFVVSLPIWDFLKMELAELSAVSLTFMSKLLVIRARHHWTPNAGNELLQRHDGWVRLHVWLHLGSEAARVTKRGSGCPTRPKPNNADTRGNLSKAFGSRLGLLRRRTGSIRDLKASMPTATGHSHIYWYSPRSLASHNDLLNAHRSIVLRPEFAGPTFSSATTSKQASDCPW